MHLSVSLEIDFCAGHRLLNYEGKCRNVHGHNYRAVICVSRTWSLSDDRGFVIDFGVLKRLIKSWIDTNWDHAMILNQHDHVFTSFLKHITVNGQSQRIFELPGNPTAENMALHLLEVCREQLKGYKGYAVQVESVTLYETDTSYATVTPEYGIAHKERTQNDD